MMTPSAFWEPPLPEQVARARSAVAPALFSQRGNTGIELGEGFTRWNLAAIRERAQGARERGSQRGGDGAGDRSPAGGRLATPDRLQPRSGLLGPSRHLLLTLLSLLFLLTRPSLLARLAAPLFFQRSPDLLAELG